MASATSPAPANRGRGDASHQQSGNTISLSLSAAIHGSTLAAALLAGTSAYAGSGPPTFQDFVNAYVWAYPLVRSKAPCSLTPRT